MDTADKVSPGQDMSRLAKRGVAEIITEAQMLELLRSGNRLRLKEGFDPSSADIHLGHMVTLRKLRQFQELGHQVVLIVADWTAQIGDPSGASITRPMLSPEQVQANAKTYMEQFFKVVDKDRTEVRWQSEWFGKFTLADVIRLASKFTVAQLLARDDFSARYSTGRPITMAEMLYPLLQAYDSVMVKADVEFGGTDQKFNLLVGRELQSMVGQRPQQCLMTPLLIGTDGSQKMSKSLGNYIGVAEPPSEIYGKVMSINDSLILQYFELLTDVPDEELEGFRQALTAGTVNPMTLKKRLGRELVTQLYSQREATEAEEHFEKVFQKREVPEEIIELPYTKELRQKLLRRVEGEEPSFEVSRVERDGKHPEFDFVPMPRVLVEAGVVSSRSEARRLIAQGAIDVDGDTVRETYCRVRIGSIIKVGKRRFVKLVSPD